jgi:hypothetical protein
MFVSPSRWLAVCAAAAALSVDPTNPKTSVQTRRFAADGIYDPDGADLRAYADVLRLVAPDSRINRRTQRI